MPHEYEDIKDVLTGDDVNTDSVMRTLRTLGIKAKRLSLERVPTNVFADEVGIPAKDLEELTVSLKKEVEEGEKGILYILIALLVWFGKR